MVKHLQDAGMNYFQHMIHALHISYLLFVACFCCFIHSFIPFIFQTKASCIIKYLSDNVINRQIRRN